MATLEAWTYEEQPPARGWYAISYSWDANEGIFPGSDSWDGSKWGKGYPVLAYAGPFESKDGAEEWAQAHDMEA